MPSKFTKRLGRRATLTAKRGNVNYYKGRGGRSEGVHTSKGEPNDATRLGLPPWDPGARAAPTPRPLSPRAGKFVVLAERTMRIVAPNLEGCKVRARCALGGPRLNTRSPPNRLSVARPSTARTASAVRVCARTCPRAASARVGRGSGARRRRAAVTATGCPASNHYYSTRAAAACGRVRPGALIACAASQRARQFVCASFRSRARYFMAGRAPNGWRRRDSVAHCRLVGRQSRRLRGHAAILCGGHAAGATLRRPEPSVTRWQHFAASILPRRLLGSGDGAPHRLAPVSLSMGQYTNCRPRYVHVVGRAR